MKEGRLKTGPLRGRAEFFLKILKAEGPQGRKEHQGSSREQWRSIWSRIWSQRVRGLADQSGQYFFCVSLISFLLSDHYCGIVVLGNMETGGLGSFGLRGNWENFKVRLEQYLIINDDKLTTDIKKRAVFLNALEDDSFSLLSNLCIPKKLIDFKLEELIAKLNEYCGSSKCFFNERSKFYAARQLENESVKDFSVRLKSLSVDCKFGNFLPEVLRDIFVLGCKPSKTREKLFLEGEKYTFEKCIQVADCVEAISSDWGQGRKQELMIAKVDGTKQARKKFVSPGRAKHASPSERNTMSYSRSDNKNRIKCFCCGYYDHVATDCKFKGYICRNCNKKGHLARQCSSKINRKSVNTVISTNIRNAGTLESINSIDNNEPYYVEVLVNNVRLQFILDSGASCCVIPECIYLQHFTAFKLTENNMQLFGFNNNTVQVVGSFVTKVQWKEQCCDIKFIIVRDTNLLILGRDFMKLFNLGISGLVNCISDKSLKERLMHKFPEVFTDRLGRFNKYEVELRLKDSTVPVFRNNRIIPFALKEKVECEINKLLTDGIIEPVSCSEYASAVVPVIKKNGNIRICGDFKTTINPQLSVDKYPLPRIEELLARLNGGKVFAKIDLRLAYNQFVLKKECRQFTTINTHLGLFRYNRLVFGLSSSPAIFAKAMQSCLGGLKNMAFYLDDIIVIGEDEKDLENNVCIVLERLKDCGLTVNCEKCEFNLEEIEFLGYKINKEGILPCDRNKEAVLKAPHPKDLGQLRSLLGLISYYRNFIPNMASVLAPLYELLKKDVKFLWGKKEHDSFEDIKKMLTSDRILAHFNENVTIKLVTDGSLNGIAATLLHVFRNGTERPIGYASRTLNKAEKNYSILDIEATAIIFGIKKFYQYLYGREFILAVDNQPLVRIFGNDKEIPKIAASRLQRYAVTLASFNYKIEYVKSKNNCSDFLSRCPVDNVSACDSVEAGYVNYFENNGLNLSTKLIKTETENDHVLSQVKMYLIEGWKSFSTKKIQGDNFLRIFWEKRLELSILNGCILYQHRVIIPESLREKVLNMLHRSHLGIFKTKGLAKSFVWWPKINRDLELLTKNCRECLEIKPESQKSTLAVWPYESEVWFRIHIDHGSLFNKNFLVVVDSSSKWIECIEVNSLSSKENIEVLCRLFSQLGFPGTLVSDNGTCFCSMEFEDFCKRNGIEHITSPVYHPSSNGQAENAVKTCKNFLKKICVQNKFPKDYKEQLCNFLTDYRNTIHATTGFEPSVLLLGRKIRTVFDSLIPRNVENSKDVVEDRKISSSSRQKKVFKNVEKNQVNQKNQYKGRHKNGFNVGQKVMTRDFRSQGNRLWVPGVIMDIKGNKLYFIKICNTHMVWKRHLDQIRELHVSWQEETSPRSFASEDQMELQADEMNLSGLLRSRRESNSSPLCFRQQPWQGRLRPR